jgi:hypothetical protein
MNNTPLTTTKATTIRKRKEKSMNDQKATSKTSKKSRSLKLTWLGLALGLGLACWASLADEDSQGTTAIRWDLIHVFANGPTDSNITAGGSDSAKAADGSEITLTGSGTFQSVSDEEDQGESQGVTGGGTWETFDNGGASTGSGTYKVTGLVSFSNAGPNGVPPPTFIDTIGSYLDARGGLAVLRIAYSDGEKGVLTVSCHGPVNVPNTVFEGITTTKGIVGYVDRGKPVSGVDGNRTIFHVLPNGQNNGDENGQGD